MRELTLTLAAALSCLIGAVPASALSQNPYITPSDYDVLHLLPPPPAPGSQAERKDVEAVAELRAASSPERVALAEKDATVALNAFSGTLAPGFDFAKLPGVEAFFGKVGRDAQFATTVGKDCWERPRPFVLDSDIHPPGTMKQGTLARPGDRNTAPRGPGSPCPSLGPVPQYSYSYPSGHSTFGAMTAILLSDMVPEKRAELYARGWQFGESRIVGGVHYPTDVDAGRIDATALVAVMMRNPDFRTDLAAAGAELRASLGLNP